MKLLSFTCNKREAPSNIKWCFQWEINEKEVVNYDTKCSKLVSLPCLYFFLLISKNEMKRFVGSPNGTLKRIVLHWICVMAYALEIKDAYNIGSIHIDSTPILRSLSQPRYIQKKCRQWRVDQWKCLQFLIVWVDEKQCLKALYTIHVPVGEMRKCSNSAYTHPCLRIQLLQRQCA